MTNDGVNTLTYDVENHTLTASGAYGSGSYVYDGNGLRVQKAVTGGTTTVYIFSGSKVIAEYDNGAAPASPSREYIYSGGALLAKVDSSGTKYYHQDHLSNRLVTDSSGNWYAEMGTFPYGESWYNTAGDKLLFTTYERDAESGNDYAQARYNVNRLARFSSLDPLPGSTSDPQSLNRYSYVRNMPVMAVDPSGMWPCVATNPPDDGENKGVDSSGKYFVSDAEPEPLGTICLDGVEIDLSGGGGDGQGGGGLNGLVTADSIGSVWSSGFGFAVLPTDWGYVFLRSRGSVEDGYWVDAYYLGLPGGGGSQFANCLKKYGNANAKANLTPTTYADAQAAAAASGISTTSLLALWDNENSLQDTFPPVGPHGEIGPIQITPGAVADLTTAGTLPTNYASNTTANLTAGGLYYSYLINHYQVPANQAAAAYNGGSGGYSKPGPQAYQQAFNQKQQLFQKLVNCLQ